jgi:hypothetical protein
MSFVGVEGEAEETLCPSLGKCDGSRRAVREGRESEVIVDSGKRTVPRGNSTSRRNSVIA